MASIPTSFPSFPTTSARTEAGVTHIDLNFASAMSKGSGSILVTDGTVQTVIDRVTGQPKLRVVGATFSKEIALDQVSISGTHVLFDAAGLPPGASLNVYMGAGTLLSGGKAAGAITVPGSAVFNTPASTGLSATLAVEDKTLKAGADIKVTVRFSEAVNSLDAAAIVAEHAGIKTLEASTDKLTWTITLGAGDSVESLSNVLRLDMSKVVSAAGTHGSGTLTSAPYAVDTIVDAYLFPSLFVNDEGPSDEDGVTNDDYPYVAGILQGSLAADEHIELRINGRLVDKSFIHLVGEGDSWGWYYDPDDEAGETPGFNEGANSVTARVVKADGHSSAAVTKTITVDTDAPDIVARPTGLVDAAGSISIGFDEAMYLDDNAEVAERIEVVDDLGNTSWITLSQNMLSADRKTLTIDPAAHNLATGNTYQLYLPSGLSDLAGNTYDGPGIGFTTAGPYQDKAPPRLVQAYIANGSGIYGKDDVLEFRLRYSERINLDAGTENDLVLYLHNGNVARYTGLSEDRKEMIFTYTVEAGDDVEHLYDVYYSSSLLGHVRDDAGNVFQNAHVEYDYLLSTEDGYGAVVSIDTVVAKPGAPQLHASSDSGALGDNSTTDTTPRLLGSGAEAYARISIYGGDLRIGTAVADASGNWDTVVTTELGAGTHPIRIIQEDRAGNVSEASAALDLTITVTTTPPDGLPAVTRVIVDSDHYVRAGETISFRVRFNESVERVGTSEMSLGLNNGARALFSGISGNEASFTYTVAANEDQEHLAITDTTTLVGHIADLSGNLLDAAHIVLGGLYDGSGYGTWVDIDTIAPARPNAPQLDPDSNTGSLEDVLTGERRPSITGSGAERGAKVELYEGDTLLGYSYADEDGNWEVRVESGKELVDGVHTLTARQVDQAGNRGLASLPLAVTIDATVAALAAPRLKDGHDTGKSAVDGITSEDEPILVGSGAEAGARIKIMSGETVVGFGSANASGVWSASLIDGLELGDGVYHFTVKQEDSAGNLSAASPELVFTVDRTAPNPPGSAALLSGSDSGLLGDALTNVRTPTLGGSGADANAELVLYVDGREVGRPVANASGNWTFAIAAGDALSDGVHGIQLRQLDTAGNESTLSDAFDLTIDATAAAAPGRPVLAAASDSGSSNSDGITSVLAPRFSGSGAEAGATIVLYAGTREIGRKDADASGNWDLTLLEADKFSADGSYAITAKQIDKAGNTSAASEAFTLVIDTSGPLVSMSKVSLSQREFQLAFNEEIAFRPSGQFNLLESSSTLLSFVGNSSSGSWYLSNGTGGEDSVLNFKISMSGMYNLSMANDAIQDVAGNSVQIVGSPQWVVDLLEPSA